MTSSINVFEKLKTSMFKTYSHDAGKMLLHTGTIGWILSAAAQIFGIVNNDKVSKEQKKFLIPQEMADAAVNILAFYMVTNSIQNIAKKLASSGKLITPAIKEFCIKNGIKFEKIKGEETPNIGKMIIDEVKDFESTLKVNEKEILQIDSLKTDKLKKEINKFNEFYDKTYEPFEGGLKVIGNLLGAIISCNIITPILRNKFAAAKQKQSIAQDKMQAQNDSLSPYTPVVPMQNRFGIDDYRSKVMNVSSGSMKV